jgi:hypothetical protein
VSDYWLVRKPPFGFELLRHLNYLDGVEVARNLLGEGGVCLAERHLLYELLTLHKYQLVFFNLVCQLFNQRFKLLDQLVFRLILLLRLFKRATEMSALF